MTNKKISELTELATPADDDVLPIVSTVELSGDVTKKIKWSSLVTDLQTYLTTVFDALYVKLVDFLLVNLNDVVITTPTDGQVLTYDTTTSKWINESIPKYVMIGEDLSSQITGSNNDFTLGHTAITVQLAVNGRYQATSLLNSTTARLSFNPTTSDIVWAYYEVPEADLLTYGGITVTYLGSAIFA